MGRSEARLRSPDSIAVLFLNVNGGLTSGRSDPVRGTVAVGGQVSTAVAKNTRVVRDGGSKMSFIAHVDGWGTFVCAVIKSACATSLQAESLSLVIDIVDGDAGNGNGVDDERSHVRVGGKDSVSHGLDHALNNGVLGLGNALGSGSGSAGVAGSDVLKERRSDGGCTSGQTSNSNIAALDRVRIATSLSFNLELSIAISDNAVGFVKASVLCVKFAHTLFLLLSLQLGRLASDTIEDGHEASSSDAPEGESGNDRSRMSVEMAEEDLGGHAKRV